MPLELGAQCFPFHHHLPLLTHGDKFSLLTAFPPALPVLFLLYQATAALRLFTSAFQPLTFPSAEKVAAAEGVPQRTSFTWTDVFTGDCSGLRTVGVVGEDAPHYIDGGGFCSKPKEVQILAL